jgi:peptidoglycan-N-acetylglucosamine deacetylase
MAAETLSWPQNKRIAVALTVMYEAWSEGKAPTYSIQTTHLKPGAVDYAGAA